MEFKALSNGSRLWVRGQGVDQGQCPRCLNKVLTFECEAVTFQKLLLCIFCSEAGAIKLVWFNPDWSKDKSLNWLKVQIWKYQVINEWVRMKGTGRRRKGVSTYSQTPSETAHKGYRNYFTFKGSINLLWHNKNYISDMIFVLDFWHTTPKTLRILGAIRVLLYPPDCFRMGAVC